MAVSLRPHPTVPGSQVLAYGAARGDLEVPNDDLVGPIDSSDEWIRKRTGIVTRTRASKDVGVKDLSLTAARERSEEHTSELQSRGHLVCRLLLEKKKKTQQHNRRVNKRCDR